MLINKFIFNYDFLLFYCFIQLVSKFQLEP